MDSFPGGYSFWLQENVGWVNHVAELDLDFVEQ